MQYYSTEINKLADNAAQATKSEDALRYSQAALNLAHVVATMAGVDKYKREAQTGGTS